MLWQIFAICFLGFKEYLYSVQNNGKNNFILWYLSENSSGFHEKFFENIYFFGIRSTVECV